MHPSHQNTMRSQGLSRREIILCRESEGAFTLVEMLLSMAILALLVVMVSQMVGSVSSSTAASGKRISTDDEARTVFDRMAGDFEGMVTRPDVNPLWKPGTGATNDVFYFYSQAPATSTNTSGSQESQIALVGYTLNGTNGLCRIGVGVGWDDLTFTNGPVSKATVITTDFINIAPSVVRMEYSLLMKPGSTNNNGTTNGVGVYSQTNNPGQSMQDVAGITVALVILDQASQRIVTSTALNNLRTSTFFPDATTTGIPVGTWITNARTRANTGLPAGARAQIRVYQRYFPLNR